MLFFAQPKPLTSLWSWGSRSRWPWREQSICTWQNVRSRFSERRERKKICQYLYEEAFKIIRSGQNSGKMSSKRKLSQQHRLKRWWWTCGERRTRTRRRRDGMRQKNPKKLAGKSWKNVNILFGNQDNEKWQKQDDGTNKTQNNALILII